MAAVPDAATFERWHDDPDVAPFVVRDDRRLVAYGEISEDHEAAEAELARLLVAPHARGNGIGRWLARALADEAHGRGFADVWLRVVPDNAAALRAYVAAGFVPAAADAERAFNVGQPVAYRWLHDGTSTALDVTGRKVVTRRIGLPDPHGAPPMKLFLDTADIEEIRTVVTLGRPRRRHDEPDAVREGRGHDLRRGPPGDLQDHAGARVRRGRRGRRRRHARRRAGTSRSWPTTSWSRSPMSENGLAAISRFRAEGIKTNCTLIFTANQGLLAAKAGASLLSPFVGRVDDINEEGMIVIRELVGDHQLLRARLRGARRRRSAIRATSPSRRSPARTSRRCRSRSSSRWSATR